MPIDPYKAQFMELRELLKKEAGYPHWDKSGKYALGKAIKWTEAAYHQAEEQKVRNRIWLSLSIGIAFLIWFLC